MVSSLRAAHSVRSQRHLELDAAEGVNKGRDRQSHSVEWAEVKDQSRQTGACQKQDLLLSTSAGQISKGEGKGQMQLCEEGRGLATGILSIKMRKCGQDPAVSSTKENAGGSMCGGTSVHMDDSPRKGGTHRHVTKEEKMGLPGKESIWKRAASSNRTGLGSHGAGQG